MLRLSGKAVYKGIVLGSVSVLKKNDQQVKRQKVEDADAEIARLGKAGGNGSRGSQCRDF